MKIEADRRAASDVVLWLTRSEAEELRDALIDLLDRFDDPSFHAHVSSDDHQSEISITAATSPIDPAGDAPSRHD